MISRRQLFQALAALPLVRTLATPKPVIPGRPVTLAEINELHREVWEQQAANYFAESPLLKYLQSKDTVRFTG